MNYFEPKCLKPLEFVSASENEELAREWIEQRKDSESVKIQQSNVLKYLKSGLCISAVPVVERDALTGKVLPNPNKMTDGVWIWINSITHYVKTYNICLPIEFLAHIESHGYVCPLIGYDQLDLSQVDFEEIGSSDFYRPNFL